jgi:hypothetical protein
MTPGQDSGALRREKLRDGLRKSIEGLEGIYPVDRYEGEVSIGKLRRRGVRAFADPTRSLTLMEDANGVLLWEDGAAMGRPVAGLRRGYRGTSSGPSGDIIEHLVVEPLDPSEVGKTLTGFDRRLTPNQGLRQVVKGNLLPPDDNLRPVETGRILLFIHGTFSESKAILTQLSNPANKVGRALLGRAAKHYDQILAFDHPTLSVSPMLNALDLARRLDATKADIDVVCHSRGGLVTRWWLEAFDRPAGKRRAILVGAPLEGTSLAAPPRLKEILSWFSNLNKFLAGAASMIPFLTVVSCLARLTATVTNVVAETPLVDAAIALVPGLAAMSRTSNSFELSRLNMARAARPQYYAIKSRYKPDDPGWKFWEYFVDKPLQRAAHSIFPGDNDLVVDTASMTVLESVAAAGGGRKIGDIVPERVHDFGEGNEVCHTNYFAQAATSQKIAEWLQIP